MIIRNILLQNIRSYKTPQPIQLAPGTTLFEGDIGSGKSTILLSIEFALFGLGDIEGSYLLRHGEKKGSVQLEFTINSHEYKVYRSLERKKTSITQKEGYIVEDGTKTDYSVGEMKTRILEILNFNERPKPKTSSLIYRYAIFTPQEMMKEVLLQPAEKRLETLRRAFRIEDYSIISNNTSVMLTWIDRETELLKRQTKDITEKQATLCREKEILQGYNQELSKLTNELESLRDCQQQVSSQIEKLQKQKEHVQQLQTEIPHIEKELEQQTRQIADENNRAKKLQETTLEIEAAEQALIQLRPQYEELIADKKRLNQLETPITEAQKLTRRVGELSKVILNEKNHIEKEINKLQTSINTLKDKICDQKNATLKISPLEQNENELTAELENLQPISEKLQSLKQEQSRLQQDIKNRKERSDQLRLEFNDLKRIGIGAQCPKCKQELTQNHYEDVEKGYENELKDLAIKIDEAGHTGTDISLEIFELSLKEKALKQKQVDLSEIREELATLRQQEKAVLEKETELNQNTEQLNKNRNSLTDESYAKEEREELAKAKTELENLAPLQTEYDQLKDKTKQMENLNIQEKYLRSTEKISKKDSVQQEIAENKAKIESFAAEIAQTRQKIDEKKTQFDQEKHVLTEVTALETEKRKIDQKCELKASEVAAKKRDKENSEKETKRIQEEIKTRENQLLRLDEFKQYETWLSEYFIPTIKSIENHVMANINSEFNQLFQKWLSQLLETGDITVRVDDKFTPIIEQNGYEMDVASLSGGEKTSVALAYRLALNVMVKKVCEAMQSNLLILDEPTDGFSREQLFRLRDILNELKCEQVITVSHETELESFVDKIYRITKEAGESKIVVA
jgi:DNA repair protein SbcC/Rad50